MNKKILILGATGMAGHMLYYYLKENFSYSLVTCCFRNKLNESSYILDVHNEDDIRRILSTEKPDIVINCVGILIKGSKENIGNCIYINSYYPHLLSKLICAIIPNSKLIHISTDCVFSGNKGSYLDSDVKDALDIYGMSKNLGEVINNRDLTIRTSIIGPELKKNGEGLMHWIFCQRHEGSLNGYTKSIWGGVTTLELAKVIAHLVDSDLTGLVQVSNSEKIDKHSLISMIVKQFNLPVTVKSVDGIICDKSIIASSCLKKYHTVPSYQIMIKENYDYMISHKYLYSQYFGE